MSLLFPSGVIVHKNFGLWQWLCCLYSKQMLILILVDRALCPFGCLAQPAPPALCGSQLISLGDDLEKVQKLCAATFIDKGTIEKRFKNSVK